MNEDITNMRPIFQGKFRKPLSMLAMIAFTIIYPFMAIWALRHEYLDEMRACKSVLKS